MQNDLYFKCFTCFTILQIMKNKLNYILEILVKKVLFCRRLLSKSFS